MKKERIQKIATWSISIGVILFVIWFSGLSVRNYVSLNGYQFTDNMRTYSSVFFSLASNRHAVSSPVLSLQDRRFVKYITNPITHFTLKPPSVVNFEKAEVAVSFKVIGDMDIDVEAGKGDGSFLPKRLFSFDQQVDVTNHVDFGDFIVAQQGIELEAGDDLVAALNEAARDNSIAVFTNNLDLKTSAHQFEISKSFQSDIALKGKHHFLTYSDGRPIEFKMSYIDVNENSGPDRINLRIKKGGEILAYTQIADDGNESDSGQLSALKNAQVRVDDVEPGIYEIELDNSDDIIARSLSLNTQHLVAKDSIAFASEYLPQADSVRLFTKGGYIVPEPGEQFEIIRESTDADLQELRLGRPSYEAELLSDSFLSFTEDSYLDLSSIEFVDRSERKNADILIFEKDNASLPDRKGWITSHVEFTSDEVTQHNGEIPLRLVTNGGGVLILDRITVTLK